MTKTKTKTKTGKISNKISPIDSKHVLKPRRKNPDFGFLPVPILPVSENWPLKPTILEFLQPNQH